MHVCIGGGGSGGARSEKSERNGGDFDAIFQSKGIPNKFYAILPN